MNYVLGLDLGTSSLKGILVEKSGEVAASCSVSYPLMTEKIGYSEQNPQKWIDACDEVLDYFSEKIEDFTDGLEGISFSGQMHSLILLDSNMKVLRPAILWNDTRTTQQCQYIMRTFGDELLRITKNRALEGFTLPKILWVKENEPEIWSQVSHIQLPKDYLRYYLTGQLYMEYSDAAGTLLLDIKQKIWSSTVADKFGISTAILPTLVASGDYVGNLQPKLKKRWKFKKDVKVFAGGADNACAALGSGLLFKEDCLCSIGTSGVCLSIEDNILENQKGVLHLFNHVLSQLNYVMGVTLSAGNSLEWFRRTFAGNSSFDSLLFELKKTSPGADGLLFTPYITGERTPYSDSAIRGAFVGIDIHHNLAEFTRAVIEGITFSLKDVLILLERETKKQFETIISVGGGTKNEDWLQIQANIFNKTVRTLKSEQGPGMGAAILAAVGIGWYPTVEDAVKHFVEWGKTYYPEEDNVIVYRTIYERYKKVYSATKQI